MATFLSRAGTQIDDILSRLSIRDRSEATRSDSAAAPPRLDYSITIAEQSAPLRPVTHKLGTFSGVFMPTSLNVLSILMFLRFPFIVGQAGLLGTIGLLGLSYAADLLTVLSISAISTNGTVRGGGAYYMISRTLGPEFGGSIGIVFYVGQILNAGMNIVGFVEPLLINFGRRQGEMARFLPDSFWFGVLYGSLLCAICAVVCTAGSRFFARFSLSLFVILGIATFSIPLSAVLVSPFRNDKAAFGISSETLIDNLMPRFTRGAAGSQQSGRESIRSIFGILFPAAAGIFAGSADSGQLANPSRSIPKGTLGGLGLTFWIYLSVILVLAAGVPRAVLHTDLTVLQDINLSPYLVLMGSLATATFSSLCGINGAAKMLQAIARDDGIPHLGIFKYGTKASDEPLLAILISWLLTQCVLFADINQIASFVTMTFLLTFAGINLACFLLDVSSAPNFRPSFRFYSWHTALSGFLFTLIIMFFVDGGYAGIAFASLGTLFLMIHYLGSPKNYGDISQALIYHQVRKFLLRLDKGRDHVKFWRPQILLLVNDARRNIPLIRFCNALKKSGLYVLGHVMITDDFSADLPELRKQQGAWHRLVEILDVKAFVQVGVAIDEVWGAMNMCLSSGLGGMKPNIVVMSYYNMAERKLIDVDDPSPIQDRRKQAVHDTRRNATPRDRPGPTNSRSEFGSESESESESGSRFRNRDGFRENYLPTDGCRANPPISIKTYVNIMEDIIASFNINIAVARGFSTLEMPGSSSSSFPFSAPGISSAGSATKKKYIDLWPIQMSPSSSTAGNGPNQREILSTNFDTYTMILQMGQILYTVPKWRKAFKLRVLVFVEYQSDVEEERRRVALLLENLRIEATLIVLHLDNRALESYEVLVHDRGSNDRVDRIMKNEVWWTQKIKSKARFRSGSRSRSLSRVGGGGGRNGRNGGGEGGGEDSVAEMIRATRRRMSSTFKPLSAPLSFRTNVPIPRYDEESDSEGSEVVLEFDDDNDNEVIGPDDEESGISNMRFRRPVYNKNEDDSDNAESEGDDGKERDDKVGKEEENRNVSFDSHVIPARTQIQDEPLPINETLPSDLSTSPNTTTFFPPKYSAATPHNASQTRSTGYKLGAEDGDGSGPKGKRGAEVVDTIPSISFAPELHTPVDPSFNDLPARAQHLIINDLIASHSHETSVLFTTLPPPGAGTYKDEVKSESYLDSLGVLSDGLPPVVMIHSKSLTVTTAL